ncbi:dipeptidase [Paractinoplanes lichenicola]|uniref:Dipeptidase n=1 Tax=Paractinoplanes lichenicola TaxID=2802976 RepID=A0ABS1W4I5_9ACTN|nr:dipeptidase [Actinoplanes lichenicola]MBL7261649.1 dipeptidase [Actinoplanes lichenicola]
MELIIDGHNDLPMQLRGRFGYRVEGLDQERPELQTDIPRLRAGGVGGQFWSVYVPGDLSEPEAVVATMEQIDAVYRMAAAYPDDFAIAYSADHVEQAMAAGKIASLLGIEGGHSLATSLGVLRAFARLGVRYVTLTHNENLSWADSAVRESRVGGLNDEGRAVVREMQRIGVLVDLSHVAPVTMHAALDTAFAPVIFSHSGVRALHDHPRNVPDDVLTRLRDNGGVIQLTFVAPFVSAESRAWMAAADEEWQRLGPPSRPAEWPRAPRPGEDPATLPDWPGPDRLVEPEFASWLAANPRPPVTVAQVADQVEHARDVAGVDHIGLGGDYDGTPELPDGMGDVSSYPLLLTELAGRGWSDDDLGKLAGRNILRALRESERLAEEPLWPPVPAR